MGGEHLETAINALQNHGQVVTCGIGHEHWLLLNSETGFANAARTNQYNGGIIRKGSGVQGQQRGLRPLTRRMHALRSISTSSRATNFEETRLSRPVAYVATVGHR